MLALPHLLHHLPCRRQLCGTHSVGQEDCRCFSRLQDLTQLPAQDPLQPLVRSPVYSKFDGSSPRAADDSSDPSSPARLQRLLWAPPNPIPCLPLDIPRCTAESPAGRESVPEQQPATGTVLPVLRSAAEPAAEPHKMISEHFCNDLSCSGALPADSSRVLGGACSSERAVSYFYQHIEHSL